VKSQVCPFVGAGQGIKEREEDGAKDRCVHEDLLEALVVQPPEQKEPERVLVRENEHAPADQMNNSCSVSEKNGRALLQLVVEVRVDVDCYWEQTVVEVLVVLVAPWRQLHLLEQLFLELQ
jgi:hypothetical protein